ncbi:unnamed protein product [Ixodes persulcatus]
MTSSETNQQRLSALHLCHWVLQGECAGLMSLKSLVAVFPLCHYFSRAYLRRRVISAEVGQPALPVSLITPDRAKVWWRGSFRMTY